VPAGFCVTTDAFRRIMAEAPSIDDRLDRLSRLKPNGLFGKAYMAGIGPFRHLIVYPALTRQWERAWRERVDRIGTENGELRRPSQDGGHARRP
jgi:phosphoenolpyruvate synthase/pyruvate phosphate dikinase